MFLTRKFHPIPFSFLCVITFFRNTSYKSNQKQKIHLRLYEKDEPVSHPSKLIKFVIVGHHGKSASHESNILHKSSLSCGSPQIPEFFWITWNGPFADCKKHKSAIKGYISSKDSQSSEVFCHKTCPDGSCFVCVVEVLSFCCGKIYFLFQQSI